MAHEKATEKYASQSIPSPGNPNHNEAWALIEAARRIASIIQYGDLTQAEDKKKFRAALRLNMRVWTIIQAEQLVGENQLPGPIRQNILTLCKFIDEHTMRTMAEPSADRAVVLIDINRNIASGLLGNPDDNELPAPDADAEAAFGGSGDEPEPPKQGLKIEA